MALLAPAGTVTLDGPLAMAELLLESATTAPPEPAGPLKVTVPVDVPPLVTLVGLSVCDDTVSAGPAESTVSVVNAAPVLFQFAVSETLVSAATALVPIVKLTLSVPAGTVTLAGRITTPAGNSVNTTCAPPAGARPLRTTRPVEGFPPTTCVGSTKKVLILVACGVAVTINWVVNV